MNLAIDPGIHDLAVAGGSGRYLEVATLLRGIQTAVKYTSVCSAVLKLEEEFAKFLQKYPTHGKLTLEWPQIYTRSEGKKDPNYLLSLAAVDGAISTCWKGAIVTVHPHDWKRTLTKEATEVRIRRRLNNEESLILAETARNTPTRLFHNVLDAVGIFLDSVGRF